MKKPGLILTLLITLIFMSFKFYPTSERIKFRTGVYSICNCSSLPTDSLKTVLSFNDNFTFYYLDKTNPGKIIDVKGKWNQEGNIITLTDFNSEIAIQSKWTIDENEKCLRSRKGLNFTRLCNLEACK